MKMKQKNLWILSGIPASGKSTFINKLWPNCGCVVSRDTIRFQMLNDDESYFGKEKSVWNAYIEAIKLGLKEYDNVYADATHLNPNSRRKLLTAINAKEYKNLNVNVIYFSTPVEECIKRNEKREGRTRVPESVIRSMANSFVKPTFNECIKYHIIEEVNDKGEVISQWQSF